MKKMKLNLDELNVQSFASTSKNKKRSGTVMGNETSFDPVDCTLPVIHCNDLTYYKCPNTYNCPETAVDC